MAGLGGRFLEKAIRNDARVRAASAPICGSSVVVSSRANRVRRYLPWSKRSSAIGVGLTSGAANSHSTAPAG